MELTIVCVNVPIQVAKIVSPLQTVVMVWLVILNVDAELLATLPF